MQGNELFDLRGKIALVTGSSHGIGAAVAGALADYGAEVIISSRKIADCETVAQSIRERGGKAAALACNTGDMAQLEALFAEIEKHYGRLDILVNNAATSPYYGHILDTDPARFQKTVDVNLRGYFFASVYAAKLMAKHSGGSIINVASVGALHPMKNQGIYSITKGAVIAMTKAFANECADSGVRVNALLPGVTDTKLASAMINDEMTRSQLLPRLPLQRFAQPSEMAGAVIYLASAASSYTTGSCITVDGGFLSK